MWAVVGLVGLLMGITLPCYREVQLHDSNVPLPSLRYYTAVEPAGLVARFLHRVDAMRLIPVCRSRCVQLYSLLQQPAVWRLILALTTTTALSLITNQAQVRSLVSIFRP